MMQTAIRWIKRYGLLVSNASFLILMTWVGIDDALYPSITKSPTLDQAVTSLACLWMFWVGSVVAGMQIAMHEPRRQ